MNQAQDLDTVGDAVTALVCTYAAALEYYTGWKQRRWRGNGYRTRSSAGAVSNGFCAASISLGASAAKIREAFDSAAEMLGEEFNIGDETGREALHANLERLQGPMGQLQAAIIADNVPLELAEVIRVSEAVRVSSLAALAKQYQRVAVRRLVPRDLLPAPKPRSWLDVTVTAGDDSATVTTKEAFRRSDGGSNDGDDREGGYGIKNDVDDARTVCRGGAGSDTKSPHRSEPPSPPLTPKMVPDGL
ncbi:hypothetical protein F5Y15DRAFT_266672 [Xylariaceae sp. FL0016]|nr:hypothetical protein F5Y15DRAFT_266672 [Xylariaceae sp. FL0016]